MHVSPLPPPSRFSPNPNLHDNYRLGLVSKVTKPWPWDYRQLEAEVFYSTVPARSTFRLQRFDKGMGISICHAWFLEEKKECRPVFIKYPLCVHLLRVREEEVLRRHRDLNLCAPSGYG